MNTFQVPCVPLCGEVLCGGGVSGSEAWVTWHSSGACGGGDAGVGAFDDEGALELGGGSQDMQGEASGRRSGVDGVAQGAKMGAALGQGVEQLDEVHE